MKCTEAQYLMPLYWSGELDAQAAAELDQHAVTCGECARRMAADKNTDEVLRASMQSEAVEEAAILTQVRNVIAEKPHAWRWQWRWTVPLAATAALVITLLVFSPKQPAAQNPSHPVTRQTVNILSDAADDHNDEVVQHFSREWLYGANEIKKLVADKAGSSDVVTEIAPPGYHVDRARICELGMRNYVHLVYSDGTHEVSMFVRQQDGEQLAGTERDKVNGEPVVADSYQKLQVAAFQSPDFTVVLVSDQPISEAIDFAKKAAGAVREKKAVRPVHLVA